MPPKKPSDSFNNSEGWKEYRQLLIKDIESLKNEVRQNRLENQTSHSELKTEVGKINTKIVLLEYKSSFWGAAAGGVICIGVLLIKAYLFPQ